MSLKLLLGALFIFILSKINSINADNDTKQISSEMLGLYDGNISVNTSRMFSEHLRIRRDPDKSGPCDSCGEANGEKGMQPLIRGGRDVSPPYKYPWMVKLRMKVDKETYECAGSIITQYHVLTATHCIIKKRDPLEIVEPENVIVYFVTESYKLEKGPKVEKVISHTGFDPFIIHDIGILKLKDKIMCDKYKKPICFPPVKFVFPEDITVTCSGWGLNSERKLQSKLQEASLKVQNVYKCPMRSKVVREAYVCLKGEGQNTCSGDSGGPAFFEYEERNYIIGVLSSGTCSVTKNAYAYYTSIQYHLQWIWDQIRDSL